MKIFQATEAEGQARQRSALENVENSKLPSLKLSGKLTDTHFRRSSRFKLLKLPKLFDKLVNRSQQARSRNVRLVRPLKLSDKLVR